jgi:hypothetical protein
VPALLGHDELCAAGELAARNVDRAGQDDHEAGADVAGCGESVARTKGTDRAEAAHAVDLSWFEDRKDLIPSPLED